MDAHTISNENTKKSRNINSIVTRSILKKGNHSRVLYAGPSFDNIGTIKVCKVVELFRGKFFYEETVYNPLIKSVHSTLTSLNQEHFDKVVPAKDILFQKRFYPNPQIVACTFYARKMENGEVFHNVILKDYRTNQGIFTPLFDFFHHMKIKSYMNK